MPTSNIFKIDCTYHTSYHATSRDKISRHLKSTDITPPQKYRFDIKMTTVSGVLNNLLGTAATPQQRLGKASVTNIPEHFKDELQRLFTTSVAPDRQKHSKIVKKPTFVKIDHAGQSIKDSITNLCFYTPNLEKQNSKRELDVRRLFFHLDFLDHHLDFGPLI